jgi:hypothetical protein
LWDVETGGFPGTPELASLEFLVSLCPNERGCLKSKEDGFWNMKQVKLLLPHKCLHYSMCIPAPPPRNIPPHTYTFSDKHLRKLTGVKLFQIFLDFEKTNPHS